MGARQRRFVPRPIGLLLIVLGFLSSASSYFLLPLYVTTLNCFDSCTPPKRPTAWELSLNVLSHLKITPVPNALFLVGLYLPLLMGVLVVGCGLALLVHPRRTLAVWSHRAWLAGIIALLLWLPFLLFGVRPETGYLGMLAGYALIWGGNRVFLAAQPEAHAAS